MKWWKFRINKSIILTIVLQQTYCKNYICVATKFTILLKLISIYRNKVYWVYAYKYCYIKYPFTKFITVRYFGKFNLMVKFSKVLDWNYVIWNARFVIARLKLLLHIKSYVGYNVCAYGIFST